MNFSKNLNTAALCFGCTALLIGFSGGVHAQDSALTITNDPVPGGLRERVYNSPVQTRDIRPAEVGGKTYYQPIDTLVGRKIRDLNTELFNLRNDVEGLSETVVDLERQGEEKSAEYYSVVATVNTQLRAGSTPGNPRLENKVTQAQNFLEDLSSHVARMSQLAVDGSNLASSSSFLLESVRSTYNLTGAVEEDHVRLAELEDAISNTVVVIERILNNISDDISRSSAYLSAERQNLRSLALAVANGDLYGKSLARRPFSAAPPRADESATVKAAGVSTATATQGRPVSTRPLVKIRFDKPDVKYQQPVYVAINEALSRFPNARFELVAVQPSQGNPAEVALESTRARRNAEEVLRSLTSMGMPLDRVDISYQEDNSIRKNEVHLYIR